MLWNDPDIGIQWPLDQLCDSADEALSLIKLAEKDRYAQRLMDLKAQGELEIDLDA